MNFNKVTDNFCVSEQITVSDLQTIKEAGFKSIICNRPENESSDQTSYNEIQKHCELLGLSFFNLPIIPGQFNQELIHEFKHIISEDSQGPFFAYCRSGTRSCTLWALAHLHQISKEDILIQTKKAGYDLTQLFS